MRASLDTPATLPLPVNPAASIIDEGLADITLPPGCLSAGTLAPRGKKKQRASQGFRHAPLTLFLEGIFPSLGADATLKLAGGRPRLCLRSGIDFPKPGGNFQGV